jgi:hypothetical protein
MKHLLWAGALALPLFSWPAEARANGYGQFQVGVGARTWFTVRYGPHLPGACGPGAAQAGPWYLYWPLEAHFQAPAPAGAHYFPGMMTLPPHFAGAGQPAYPHHGPSMAQPRPQGPAGAAAPPMQRAGFVPAGYHGAAPSYWYGR